MAMAFLPDGRLILAASHTSAFEAVQATSLVLFILKCQVRLPVVVGRIFALPISLALIIVIVLSLLEARESLCISSAVKTSEEFCKSPEPYTIISEGAVI